MNEIAKSPVHKQKHECIYDSILRIDELVSRLEDLKSKINGHPIPDATGCASTTLSLSELLADGENMIQNRLASAHDVISDIENTLF